MASAPREQLRLDVDNDKSFKNIIWNCFNKKKEYGEVNGKCKREDCKKK